jgi:prevent-host-death family protein
MRTRAKSVWQVQEAKTHLSNLIERARELGPQVITRHGTECGAVISIDDLKRLRSAQEKKPTFLEHLLNGPKLENDLVDEIFRRNPETPREIDLSDLVFDPE